MILILTCEWCKFCTCDRAGFDGLLSVIFPVYKTNIIYYDLIITSLGPLFIYGPTHSPITRLVFLSVLLLLYHIPHVIIFPLIIIIIIAQGYFGSRPEECIFLYYYITMWCNYKGEVGNREWHPNTKISKI